MKQTYDASCHCGLEGVGDEELSRTPITCVDGLHDRWEAAPEFHAHL